MFTDTDEIMEKSNQTDKLTEAVIETVKEDQDKTFFVTRFHELLLSKNKEDRDEATEMLTNKLKKEYDFYTVRHDLVPETWVYREGIYIPEGRTFIKEKCRHILGKAYNSAIVNQVMTKIEADTFIDASIFFRHNIVHEIVCQNGIIDLKNKKLLPFDNKKIHFTKIPVKYDPLATCPKIDKFFNDILETPDDKKTIYEMFGYCLWKDAFLEQAAMLLGEGRNGKGKTLELLKRMLGEENTKGIPLQSLESDNFSESELFGKLANLAGDISDTPLDHTGKFKAITGRDTLSASRKFKAKIEFVNYSKQIFATNHLPKTSDTSNAFWERWIYFRFPYTFKTQEDLEDLAKQGTCMEFYKLKDPDIIQSLSTPEEMSGLLNKAIKGLQDLLKNRKFTTSKTADFIKLFWIQRSDSFLAFCMEHIEQSPDGFEIKDDVRKAYQKYCRETGARIESSDKWMKETLAKQYGAVEDYKTVVSKDKDGNAIIDQFSGKEVKERKYAWMGIKLK